MIAVSLAHPLPSDILAGMENIIAKLTLILLVATVTGCHNNSLRIRDEFFARLDQEQNFGPYELDIDVRRGKLTANGTVASEMSRRRVTQIADSIDGVDEIHNDVVVSARPVVGVPAARLVPVAEPLAASITSEARRQLANESFSLRVLQDGDQLVLQGMVDSTEGLRKLKRIVAQQAPGTVVRSQMVVKEEMLTDDMLKTRVVRALQSEPLIRTDDLDITVRNAVVDIRGVRPNHYEIDRILSVVVMVDGVKDVKSNLRIG